MQRKIPIIVICLFAARALAVPTIVDFYDDAVIQDGDEYEIVNVWNTATVNMEGGQVVQLNGSDSSTINFYGGAVESISIASESTFNLEGLLSCDRVDTHHSAIFNVNSGMFEGKLDGDGKQININGGTVNMTKSRLSYHAVLNINKGNVTFCGIGLDRYSVLNVYGGEVTFNRDCWGEAFRMSLWAALNVYYSDIIYGGSGMDIIGYHLLDGSEFMLGQFTESEIEQINFVPEPATLVLLALGSMLIRNTPSVPA
jgi:hypothetical protein